MIATIPLFDRPLYSTHEVHEFMEKLISFSHPGLPRQQFQKIFCECTCGMVIARPVFSLHDCIIDMTMIE